MALISPHSYCTLIPFVVQLIKVTIESPMRDLYYEVTDKQLLLKDNDKPGKKANKDREYGFAIDGYTIMFSREQGKA